MQGKVLAPFDLLQGLISPWNQHDFQAVPKVHNHFVSDAVTQYIPYGLFAKTSYLTDGYLGWNPQVFGGVAQHANTMAIPYDWSQGLYRWLEFWTVWHVGRWAQLLVAGLGMLWFLRGRGCGVGAALMGATAYLLNTQFVFWIYHQWAVASFCWIPWLFGALYKIRSGQRIYGVLGALFLGLSLCGGTLQHVAFIALALFFLWVGWVPENRSTGGNFLAITWLLILVGGLGLALAAPPLEAMMHAYFENLRSGHVRGGFGYTDGWVQPLLNLAAIPFAAFPTALGSPSSLDLWKLFSSDFFEVAFFGSVPVILALVGLVSRNVPWPARLLAAAGLLIPLTPLVGVLYHRVQLLWIFGGCWCAAAWLQNSSPDEQRRLARRWWLVLLSLAGIWVVGSVLLLLLQSRWEPLLQKHLISMAAASQFGSFTLWMNHRLTSFLGHLMIWNPVQLWMLAGVALSLFGLRTLSSPRPALWMVLSAGVAIQGSACWWLWTTWSDFREDLYQKPEWVRVLQKEVGPDGRLAQASGNYATTPFGPNTLQPSQVAVAGGYESLRPNGLVQPSHPWDFPGTTHFLGPRNELGPPSWLEVYSDQRWVLWKNPEPTFGFAVFANGDREPLREGAVQRPSFNTMTVVVPAGADRIELYTNAHRGWRWRPNPWGTWQATEKGSDGALVLPLRGTFDVSRQALLQFEPASPAWAKAVQFAGAGVLLGWLVLRATRLFRNG